MITKEFHKSDHEDVHLTTKQTGHQLDLDRIIPCDCITALLSFTVFTFIRDGVMFVKKTCF